MKWLQLFGSLSILLHCFSLLLDKNAQKFQGFFKKKSLLFVTNQINLNPWNFSHWKISENRNLGWSLDSEKLEQGEKDDNRVIPRKPFHWMLTKLWDPFPPHFQEPGECILWINWIVWIKHSKILRFLCPPTISSNLTAIKSSEHESQSCMHPS